MIMLQQLLYTCIYFLFFYRFRERLGVKVVKALKRNHNGVIHASVDMLCALMCVSGEKWKLIFMSTDCLQAEGSENKEFILFVYLEFWTLRDSQFGLLAQESIPGSAEEPYGILGIEACLDPLSLLSLYSTFYTISTS